MHDILTMRSVGNGFITMRDYIGGPEVLEYRYKTITTTGVNNE